MAKQSRLQNSAARGGRDRLVERSLALRDEDAVAWLRGQGLWCEPRGSFYLFADRITDGPFELIRVWHTPARLGRRAEHRVPVRAEVVIEIDGVITLGTSTQSVTLGPSRMALLPSSSSWTLEGTVASARIEIRSRPGLWPLEVAQHGIEIVDTESTALLDVLVATAISALSSGLDPADASFSSFRAAIETLVTGLGKMRDAGAVLTSDKLLLRAALELIEREASDPALTVAQLADRLRVSRRHLHRAFAGHSATPLAEIHAARLRLARQHLDVRSHRAEVDRLEIAQRSGFRTVRAMNDVLRARQG